MISPGPLFRTFGQRRPIFRAAGVLSAAQFPALQLQQTEQTQQTLEHRLAFNEAARSASRSLSSLFDSVSDGISKAVTSPRLTNNPKE